MKIDHEQDYEHDQEFKNILLRGHRWVSDTLLRGIESDYEHDYEHEHDREFRNIPLRPLLRGIESDYEHDSDHDYDFLGGLR